MSIVKFITDIVNVKPDNIDSIDSIKKSDGSLIREFPKNCVNL